MKTKVLAAGAITVAALAALAAAVVGPSPGNGTASSHREAPLIAVDPVADNTDLYAFVSPDRPDTVTIISNIGQLQEPAGGPNFNFFGEDVLYETKIDNTGDGKEDITYQFRFRTEVRDPDTFLYATDTISTLDDPDFNVRQFYSVTRVDGKGRGTVLGRDLPVPPVNIGPRSTPNYGFLMQSAVRDLPGGIKVFAGQTDDSFMVDLGAVFDLIGLRGVNLFHDYPLPEEQGVDGVGGYNTDAMIIQVPIAQLTKDRARPTGPNDPDAVLGIYAANSRQKVRVLSTPKDNNPNRKNGNNGNGNNGDKDDGSKNNGQFVQVSRLGNPLTNEVVIPVGRKDFWNSQDPSNDEQFIDEHLEPEPTRLGIRLYDVLSDAPLTGRDDIVKLFLTGFDLRDAGGKINLNSTGTTEADLLRLNTGIAPTAPVGRGNRLGVFRGDFAGFPNGRRLEDDVTDIEIQAFICGYGTFGPFIEAFGECGGDAQRNPNNVIGDAVDSNETDRPFRTTFPYAPEPHQGYQHEHHIPQALGGP